jgi:uncharacterized metal-binding protein
LEPAPFRGWDPSILAEAAVELPHEDTGPWCRIRETIEYARRLGTTHIGVSFCVGLRREAAILTRVLEANGFRVTSVCCKVGAIPKGTLGVTEQEKIRPHTVEIMCNPLAQAELLNRERAELVLILGQCVGHDSATIARLEAPAVYLVAKDRSLGHNTVAALYQLEERRSPLVNPVTHP